MCGKYGKGLDAKKLTKRIFAFFCTFSEKEELILLICQNESELTWCIIVYVNLQDNNIPPVSIHHIQCYHLIYYIDTVYHNLIYITTSNKNTVYNKLGLSWAKLRSSWDWTLLYFFVDLVK